MIRISAESGNHINAMDINANYGGDMESPVAFKSDFILSLCELVVGAGKLTAREKSIIDRCTANVYRGYMQRGYSSRPPTLDNFHAELMRQPEPEAHDVALAMELFIKGSLNTFAKPTNVDVNNRLIVYDIKDLGKQLKTVGMLVVLDAIFNRITRNRTQGRNTWIVIDEIYLLFANSYSANFLFELWKRVRKYGAFCTGISQNVEDLLQSHTARTMLGNSEFLMMLNQAGSDRLELARLLNISETQLSYITNAEAGRGLLKCAGTIVPKAAGKRLKTGAQAARTTAKAIKAAAEAASRAAIAAARAARELARLVMQMAKLAVKATIAAVKGLAAAIAAGGWVAVVVIVVVGVVAYLILSPFGILARGGAGDTPTVADEITALNGELAGRIAQERRDAGPADKTIVSFNGREDNGFIDNWPDILAVYAVKTSMDARNPMDVAEMDERRVSMLREVFWEMNSVTSHVSETAPSPSPVASASPEATVAAEPYRVLTITVTSRYWVDMIIRYGFTDNQTKTLREMMSARNVVLLMQLVDSAFGRPATDWSGIIDVPEGGMDISLYLQGDYTETVCYIDGVPKSVSTSGCGAASVSMVIAYLTGNTSQTPYTLFKWAHDHGYYAGDGLGHSCLAKLASLYGVKGTWIENDATRITAALRAGNPVIAHMGPGVFTTDGHYIVLRGITGVERNMSTKLFAFLLARSHDFQK